jgi:hypothetical protein
MDKNIVSFARKLLQYKRAFNELNAEAHKLIKQLAEGEDTNANFVMHLERRVELIGELADQSRGLKPPSSFARAYFHFLTLPRLKHMGFFLHRLN